MNERIRKLAEQTMNSDTAPHLSEELYCFTKSEFGKFAELIIQECQQLMIDNIENQLTEDGIVLAFREHFGVEE